MFDPRIRLRENSIFSHLVSLRWKDFYPWYVLGVMLLAYVCSFIDRNIINLLVTSIKSDLDLSDTQISLLQGMAFAFFYVTCGLFISRLADIHSRRNIIIIGMVLWCMATASAGLATSFLFLFMARMAVGVGESCLTPSATSMINDVFPPKRLGLAMSIYAGGPYLGSGLALIIGGVLLDYLQAKPQIIVPILGDLYPWQAAFLIVGLPGLLIAMLIFFTIHEPERKETIGQSAPVHREMPSFKDFLAHVKKHSNIYSLIFIGVAMKSLVGYGFSAWLPTYYLRTYSMSSAEIGSMLGSSMLIGGVLGIICGGFIGDWLKSKRSDAPILLAMAAAIGSLTFGSGVILVDSANLSILLIIPMFVFKNLPVGMIYVAIHMITPNRMRAQIVALYLFVDAIIGLGFGPTAIALFTDKVYQDELMLGSSMLSVMSIALTISFLAFFLVRRPFISLIKKNSV